MQQDLASLAVVLRSRAYGESDKIVTFLSADYGKLTGIAKGAKNSRRRFANCLDPFTLVRVHFRMRANASLVFMMSCDLIEPPGALADPVKFAYAGYLTEIIDQLTVEGQPVPEMHALLSEALLGLKAGPATSGFLRTFELRVLQHLGYDPQLSRCERCARPIDDDVTASVDATHGRVLCDGCEPARSAGLTFSGAAVRRLDALRGLSLAEGRQHGLRGEDGRQATELLGRLLLAHLPRGLRSTEVIAALHAGDRHVD